MWLFWKNLERYYFRHRANTFFVLITANFANILWVGIVLKLYWTKCNVVIAIGILFVRVGDGFSSSGILQLRSK